VPPVRRGVDQHVRRSHRHRAVEHHLERLVARLAGVERQVIAEHDEALAPALDQLGDIGQVDEIVLVDLDQPQALRRVLDEHRLDQRRLAGAARAGEQHVVRRKARDELTRVGIDRLFLRIDRDQLVELDRVRMPNRLQVTATAALSPAMRRSRPIGRSGGRRQHCLDALEDALELREHGGQRFGGARLRSRVAHAANSGSLR
jgi:hypothetical protein